MIEVRLSVSTIQTDTRITSSLTSNNLLKNAKKANHGAVSRTIKIVERSDSCENGVRVYVYIN